MLFQCHNCNNTFSIFANTILTNTHLSIKQWLYCFYLLTKNKPVTATYLAKEIEVGRITAKRMLNLLKQILSGKDTKLVSTLLKMNDTIINEYLKELPKNKKSYKKLQS